MNPTKLPFYSLFAIIFCLFLQGNRNAAFAEGIYTVEGVLIEATGDTATEARTVAIDSGEGKAFTLLLQKLNANVTTPPPAQISRMVQSFAVVDEKISRNSYRALLTVSFSPAAVRSFLQQNKVSYNPNASAPVLVLPVFKQGENSTLWEDNPWHDAVNAAITSGRNTAFKLPLGDLDDLAFLDANNAPTVEFLQLSPLASKYGAEKVIILQAEPMTDMASNSQTLDITVITLDNSAKTQQSQHLIATQNESLTQLLARGAQTALPSPKKPQETAIAAPTGTKIAITANFSSLAEWIKIREVLTSSPNLKKLTVLRISARKAEMEAYSQGEAAALIPLLEQKALTAHNEGNILTITTNQ